MDSNIIEANESLKETVDNLQAQVAKQERMIYLCLQVISEFGHFVPGVIQELNKEIEKIENED